MGVLSGITVIELAGIGPGPFCGMLLADLGADVILVERLSTSGVVADLGAAAIHHRGKRSIAVDIKSPRGRELVLRLVENADALIEGMRPGVMERLDLGPAKCQARNPRLVVGRVTGWGQTGPLSQAAGHDNNYIALSGALWYASQPGQPPVAPTTLIGDLAGGALYLAIGVLAALLSARSTGRGDVIDAAMVDGSAHLMNLLLAMRAGGQMPTERGAGLLDGPHWFNTYRCADGGYVTLGSLEPQFHALLLEKLGLSNDPMFNDGYDPRRWPQQRKVFEKLFASRSRDEWSALLEGSDVCFAPVLSPEEAARHPHNVARNVYSERDGMLQANPAPRFSAQPSMTPGPVPRRGEHTEQILRAAGIDVEEIARLREANVVA